MKPMQKNEFDNVKVGDMLFVSTRWQKEIIPGDKVTKLFIIAGPYKFRKNGSLVTDDKYNCTSARLATEDDVTNIRRANIRAKKISACQKIDFGKLADSQLDAILQIVVPK